MYMYLYKILRKFDFYSVIALVFHCILILFAMCGASGANKFSVYYLQTIIDFIAQFDGVFDSHTP